MSAVQTESSNDQLYGQIRQLVDSGASVRDAITQAAEQAGRPFLAVQSAYYRHARRERARTSGKGKSAAKPAASTAAAKPNGGKQATATKADAKQAGAAAAKPAKSKRKPAAKRPARRPEQPQAAPSADALIGYVRTLESDASERAARIVQLERELAAEQKARSLAERKAASSEKQAAASEKRLTAVRRAIR